MNTYSGHEVKVRRSLASVSLVGASFLTRTIRAFEMAFCSGVSQNTLVSPGLSGRRKYPLAATTSVILCVARARISLIIGY